MCSTLNTSIGSRTAGIVSQSDHQSAIQRLSSVRIGYRFSPFLRRRRISCTYFLRETPSESSAVNLVERSSHVQKVGIGLAADDLTAFTSQSMDRQYITKAREEYTQSLNGIIIVYKTFTQYFGHSSNSSVNTNCTSAQGDMMWRV